MAKFPLAVTATGFDQQAWYRERSQGTTTGFSDSDVSSGDDRVNEILELQASRWLIPYWFIPDEIDRVPSLSWSVLQDSRQGIG